MLIGVAVVVAQLAFTYWPFMQAVFDTRRVGFDGLAIIAAGIVMLVLEVEKRVVARIATAIRPRAGSQVG